MLLRKTKPQPQGTKKTLRLVPVILLGALVTLGLSLGSAAKPTISLQDFNLGTLGQEALSLANNLIGKITHNAEPGVAANAVIAPVVTVPEIKSRKSRNARSLVRGMKQPLQQAAEEEPRTPEIARVLGEEDEKTYRKLFAAIRDGRLDDAEIIAGSVKDGGLIGVAQAQFLLSSRNPNLKFTQLAEWLRRYSDYPQAQDVYKKALSLRTATDAKLTEPPAANIIVPATTVRPMVAQTVEWKKPRNFTAENLWRTGQFEEVLKALADVEIGTDEPFEAYYPAWIKGLSAFAVQDYAVASHSFLAIANAEDVPAINRNAAAFWAARSFEKTLQTDLAAYYYEQAASDPHSYYGMLALARKSSDDKAMLDVWREPTLTKQHVAILRQTRAGARGLALLQVGEKELALRELQSLTYSKDGNKPELQGALEALSDVAVLPTLSLQPRKGRLAARGSYPALPWQPAGGFTSDPALVMAIAWNESRFEPNAHNPSGARGIMQIMPDTAERMIVGSSGSLFNPTANISLGDSYIKHLSVMNGIDGNLLLIIAGYNCGPGRVQQLYKDARHGKDPLLFIESMPLKETRDYVQKVLATYAAYRVRFGKPLAAIASLSRGEWPSYDIVRTASNKAPATN